MSLEAAALCELSVETGNSALRTRKRFKSAIDAKGGTMSKCQCGKVHLPGSFYSHQIVERCVNLVLGVSWLSVVESCYQLERTS